MCDAAVVQWRHFGENEMTYKFGEEYMPWVSKSFAFVYFFIQLSVNELERILF
jgi:hypothetical protein